MTLNFKFLKSINLQTPHTGSLWQLSFLSSTSIYISLMKPMSPTKNEPSAPLLPADARNKLIRNSISHHQSGALSSFGIFGADHIELCVSLWHNRIVGSRTAHCVFLVLSGVEPVAPSRLNRCGNKSKKPWIEVTDQGSLLFAEQ